MSIRVGTVSQTMPYQEKERSLKHTTTNTPLPMLRRPINRWWFVITAMVALVFGLPP